MKFILKENEIPQYDSFFNKIKMTTKEKKIVLIKLNEETRGLINIKNSKKSKKSKKLIKYDKYSLRAFFLLLVLILFINSIFIKKNISESINNNYNKNNTTNNNTKGEILDFHEIKSMNNINFIRNYMLKNITETEVLKYFEYIDYAKNDVYLNPQNIEKIENPKVSIIVSIYNRENYVKSTIRSIQNQNLKEIEIIYIDDYSTDNSVRYIKKEQKKDPRIVLYKNKQNMGALYSKSIGVLLAKGEYVYSLDSDDMFCSEDYLNSLYTQAKKGNYKYIYTEALYVDLVSKKIRRRRPFWTVLWSKLIQTEFYRNTIYSVGYNALNNKVNVLDDDIISDLMFNMGTNRWINEVGVCHFVHPGNHVYFRRFSSNVNLKKYCLSIVNTIKAYYQILNHKTGTRYGNYLLKTHFYGGVCGQFRKNKNVKELLDFYKKNKKENVTKGIKNYKNKTQQTKMKKAELKKRSKKTSKNRKKKKLKKK